MEEHTSTNNYHIECRFDHMGPVFENFHTTGVNACDALRNQMLAAENEAAFDSKRDVHITLSWIRSGADFRLLTVNGSGDSWYEVFREAYEKVCYWRGCTPDIPAKNPEIINQLEEPKKQRKPRAKKAAATIAQAVQLSLF